MERRLATILAADAVGFSRLVAADEEGTLTRLAALQREVLEPSIASHRGTVFKLMGDGLLAEFASVVDATKAAAEIQLTMAARNAALRNDARIDFRIGLNLGDVVAEDGDLLGDGVNIAARLQALATPGDIYISGTAFDHLKGKVEWQLESIGKKSLKNIPEPVRTYRVVLEAEAANRSSANKYWRYWSGRSKPLAAAVAVVAILGTGLQSWRESVNDSKREPTVAIDRASIGVLPFDNVSGDPEKEYFADGITEDIITDLAKFPDFMVAARTSTAAYKGKASDVREISRALGVSYILEGSVDKGGETIRVTAQLIDGATGSHMWAERYDRPLNDVFDIRDEIRKAIIGAITGYTGPLVEAEMRRAATLPASAVQARDLYYQAFAEFSKFDAEANARARALLERSIALDPNDATAHALLAWTHFRDSWLGWTKDLELSAQQALDAAKRAVALDSSNYKSNWSLASAYRLVGNQSAVEQSFQRAFALNPNDPDLLADWGEVLRDTGHVEEAVAQLERAMQLNPRYPVWYAMVLSTSYFLLERYAECLRIEGKIVEPTVVHWLQRAASHGYLGQTEAAHAAIDALFKAEPGLTLSESLQKIDWDDKLREQISIGLSKAGF